MIKQFDYDSFNGLTLIERQIGYERMFDKKQSRKLIQSKLPDIQDKTILDILSLLIIRPKRVSVSAIIEMLAERNQLTESAEDIVKKLIDLSVSKILNVSSDSKKRLYFQCNFTLDKDSLDLLAQYQYKLPLIIEPLPVNKKGNNCGSGYYLYGSDSLILNNKHNKDIDSSLLNKFNNIPLCLNPSVLLHIENKWNSMDKQETLDNFERYQRITTNACAILIKEGNKFYLTHKYDKRGRLYCCGYQVNYQGNAFNKASVEFANKQLITEEIQFF